MCVLILYIATGHPSSTRVLARQLQIELNSEEFYERLISTTRQQMHAIILQVVVSLIHCMTKRDEYNQPKVVGRGKNKVSCECSVYLTNGHIVHLTRSAICSTRATEPKASSSHKKTINCLTRGSDQSSRASQSQIQCIWRAV